MNKFSEKYFRIWRKWRRRCKITAPTRLYTSANAFIGAYSSPTMPKKPEIILSHLSNFTAGAKHLIEHLSLCKKRKKPWCQYSHHPNITFRLILYLLAHFIVFGAHFFHIASHLYYTQNDGLRFLISAPEAVILCVFYLDVLFWTRCHKDHNITWRCWNMDVPYLNSVHRSSQSSNGNKKNIVDHNNKGRAVR